MNARQLIASGAVALLLAPAAMANSVSTAKVTPDTCKTLDTRFEREDPDSQGPDIEKARLLRAEGTELCKQGKTADGVKKLKEAVRMLGAPPAKH